MKKTKTARGFGLIEFEDRYKAKCSLQKSSIATEHCIWLGVDDPEPKKLVKGEGWTLVELDKDILLTTRMHLTQTQVKDLLPYLKKFAKSGSF